MISKSCLEDSFGRHGLGADAAAAGNKVFLPDFRDQSLQRAAEKRFAEGTGHFSGAHARMPGDKLPKAGEGKGIDRVPQREGGAGVAFTFEGQNRVGAGLHPAVNEPGKMDAQKGKERIGNGIDQMADQVPAFRADRVILAPKRNDAGGARNARQFSHPIAMEGRRS